MDAEWAIERSAVLSPPNGWTHRREEHSVLAALSDLPSGSSVLNLPCASGRWIEPLVTRGFRVTCTDSSEIALAEARDRWQRVAPGLRSKAPEPAFVLAGLTQTQLPDRQFDAVLCLGLLDRLATSELRIAALRELRRISRGPVVVSFCNAFALGALPFGRSRNRSALPADRSIPVPVWALLNDLRRAGLSPVSRHAVLWGISPRWHIVSMPTAGNGDMIFGPARVGLAKTA
jgi:SAM-dependent methyltransferase